MRKVFIFLCLSLLMMVGCGASDEEVREVPRIIRVNMGTRGYSFFDKIIGFKVINHKKTGYRRYNLTLEPIDIAKDLKDLKKRLDTLEIEYIGEYYWFEKERWEKFTKKGIKDEVDGFTKFYYGWVPNSCIIYYKDFFLYKDAKQEIEKIAVKEFKKTEKE